MDHIEKRHTLKCKKDLFYLLGSYFIKVHGVIFMYFKADDNKGLVIRYIYLAVV